MIKAMRPTIIVTGIVSSLLVGYTVNQHIQYKAIENHSSNYMLLEDAKNGLKKSIEDKISLENRLTHLNAEIESFEFEIRMRTQLQKEIDWVRPECPIKLSNF